MNRYLVYKFKNPKYYESLIDCFNAQSKSINEIQDIQNYKFLKLVEHTKHNVKYYQELLRNLDINDINDIDKIPLLIKDIILDDLSMFFAKNIKKKDYKENSTGGSTGQILKFYNWKKDYYRSACMARGDSWAGSNFRDRTIKIWGSINDITNANINIIKQLSKKYFHKTHYLSSYNIKDEDFDNYIKFINQYKPVIIIGYPSVLDLFSLHIIENKMSLFSPRSIITGAETLYDFQRKNIEKVFNCNVYNRYGNREFGFIAGECNKHEGLHIASDHVVLEIINENGKLCKPGELGEIVITDLDNYAFPFIRYKTGDLGMLSKEQCSCGMPFPLLKSVEGRTFDIVIGPDGTRLPGTFWTLLRWEIKGIKQFQVVQEEINNLDINLVVNDSFDKYQKQKMITLITDKLGDKINIKINIVESITQTKSGKHRWIISKASPFIKS